MVYGVYGLGYGVLGYIMSMNTAALASYNT